MNSRAVISAIMAMSLATGGAAFGQDRGERHDRGHEKQVQRGGQQNRGHNEERRDERGAGPNHAFHKGDRLPPEYRHRNYVVDDWREHRLSAPPRGYHWVQVGGDYVLVAVATGIILDLLLNH